MDLSGEFCYVAFVFFDAHLAILFFFVFQAEDGIRDADVTGVQTCALPISLNVLVMRWAERRERGNLPPCGSSLKEARPHCVVRASAKAATLRPRFRGTFVSTNPSDDFRLSALAYHHGPRPGKIEVVATKPLGTQHDLALAYTPGVAIACEAIAADPQEAARLTARANLVAVVTNGTAVLGLGNIGPLAGKPVMEGKAVLFKKFAGIDVFDIEVDAREIDRMVEVVAALEPTFGGINLEDIKGPECFEVEERLKARMKIPVFHDDQHGTAIIVAAAVLNALHLGAKA